MRTYTIGNTWIEIGNTTLDISQQYNNLFGTITSVRPDIARGCEEKLYYEFWSDMASELCPDVDVTQLDIEEMKQVIDDRLLYMTIYYHTDGKYISITTEPCEENFYGGELGYIWITKEEAKEYFNVKRLSSKLKQQINIMFEKSVKDYIALLKGAVYYCSIYNKNEVIDCCEGFIGNDMMSNGMYAFIKQYIPNIKKYISSEGWLYSNYLTPVAQNA